MNCNIYTHKMTEELLETPSGNKLTKEEEEIIKKRLRELGYLE